MVRSYLKAEAASAPHEGDFGVVELDPNRVLWALMWWCPLLPQALRRQRVEVQVELRKAQKDEQILKRRSISITLMEKSPIPEDKNVVSAGCPAPGQDWCCSTLGLAATSVFGPSPGLAKGTWVKQPVPFLIPHAQHWGVLYRWLSPFLGYFAWKCATQLPSVAGRTGWSPSSGSW